MKNNFIEIKVKEYPQITNKGIEWIVIFERIYF